MATTRRNLALNPGPNVALTDWAVDGGSGIAALSLTVPGAPPATFPAHAARATWTGASSSVDGGVQYGFPKHFGGFTAGLPYSFTMVTRCSKIQRVRISMFWYAPSGGFISQADGTQTVLAANTSTVLSLANTVAPVGASLALVLMRSVSGTSGTNWAIADWLELGGLVVEQAAAATAQYFDGATAPGTFGAFTYVWEGTANASASDQVVAARTLTATADPTNIPPRIAVALDVSADPTEMTATILRNDPDGRQRAVRLAEPATLIAGQWAGYDYESPFGAAVTYQVTDATGTLISAPVTLTPVPNVPWLRHPGVPSLSVSVPTDSFRKDSFATRSRATSRAVFEPPGRSTPIVVTSGARKAAQTAVALRTDTAAEMAAMWALLEDESVLLLDLSPALGWGVTHEYISVGDVAETRVRDWGSAIERWFTLPYIVVDRPAGGLQAQFTWADVLASHITWTEVKTRYDTWADLLANNRNDL